MQPTLDFIKQIALDAGEILQQMAGGELGIEHKSKKDLVTLADRAAEDFIIGSLRKAFPDHTINAEESGHLAGESDHQWYIDPLDGTLNYAHGVPIYSVSIAYAYQGELTLGVVYDPTRKECFSAERGSGAWLNDQPIQVSNFENLVDCMLVTGFPGNRWGQPGNNFGNFVRFSGQAQTVRRLGSAALDAAYVGAGRLDGFWEEGVHDWDVAAAGLIIREAGGVVTNMYGDPDFLKEPISMVGANPTLHAKMLDILAEERQANSAN
jgi:myo-inositol-1(or 4)-monophosphatase